jgi:hypothetical protein
MKTFEIIAWYRNHDEKDFDYFEFEAKTPEEAMKLLEKESKTNYFKIEIKEL